LALEGLADSDNGSVYTFKFSFRNDWTGPTGSDAKLLADWPELKAWLGRSRTLSLREVGNGFVHCF
jgi:hypothetical protein